MSDYLFNYIAIHYCPHDILSRDDVYAWSAAHCEYYSEEYKNFKACIVCWDCFITEVLRDEPVISS